MAARHAHGCSGGHSSGASCAGVGSGRRGALVRRSDGFEVNARPAGLPSVAFQLRHIAASVDRLLTYAEGKDLSEAQLADFRHGSRGRSASPVAAGFRQEHGTGGQRIRGFVGADLESHRVVGRKSPADNARWSSRAHCRSHAAARGANDYDCEDREGDAERNTSSESR